MQSIEPFIKLGWYTVPLKGELKRRTDGSKTEPVFEKGWKAYYAENKNTVRSQLGGVLTGSKSGILAIDCDSTVTWQMFHALDPDYEFIFKSKGKLDADGNEKDCGTVIYKYNTAVPNSFSINDTILALDVYSDGGFVYLPTDMNKTKEPWEGRLPKLKEVPDTIVALLEQLKKQPIQAEPHVNNNTLTANCLAPLVKQFVDHRKFLPGLFKIITPKSFRQEPQYLQQGYLHPENIPEGRGSEYLSKVSAILGADISIDEELYVAAMHDINGLWPTPMDVDRLDNTITDSMVSGRASIDGKTIWQYDEEWSQHRLILHTKRQSNIELGFDDRRNIYYIVDVANEYVRPFARDSELIQYVGSVAIDVPKKGELKAALPTINVSSIPSRPFGFFADNDPTARTLNTFIRTPELSIINDPKSYAKLYRRPTTTLKYLETLVPETEMREFLLKFMKRKLETFDYSPVMLYFLGVPGSGKDTFVSLIEVIMGKVARPTTKEFLEMHNGWMLDTYFVQLDEYGDQLTTMRDKEEALGKLKAYTGKQIVQIRQMRTDGYQYKHNATFISTANKNPFGLEDGDRRIALFNTPTVLVEAPWVDDVTEVHERIMSESKDFCYYLATEVPTISGTEYMKPPETENKRILIADSMYASHKLAYALKYQMFDYIKDLAVTYACDKVQAAITNKRIFSTDLEELYEVMTDYKGDMRSLNKAIRGAGIKIRDSSKSQQKTYYYEVFTDEPFEPD